ncbi:MAG: Re/Si-specific NAD(P)(+) transhydrogenase subunit alpha [Planctomycetes bacterium]|nr:Re/Si-specific NAD(P)(+) transhydrogenase subunit alpha [Planctomycetota bacterium]
MKIAVPKEVREGENRVALIPETTVKLVKAGMTVVIETGAGTASSFLDNEYKNAGASIEAERNKLFGEADIVLKVNPPTLQETDLYKHGGVSVSLVFPHSCGELLKKMAEKKISSFSLDLIPRISRAQSMDVLSSMSSIAGYKAVMIAAGHLGKIFPMMMTAAGTILPAKVFIMGVGVAGLQAIATAKRLGASVEAYDVRPAVKEQVESLGARFVSISLETKDAQDAGGYAKAQSEEFYKKQQEMLSNVIASADVVITTALVPGKKAPILVKEDSVKRMKAGSVVVDLAAEQGGNCEATEPGKEVVKHGVLISGLKNLPSLVPFHSSQMFSRNLHSFCSLIFKEGKLNLDLGDEIIKATLVTHNGEVLWK